MFKRPFDRKDEIWFCTRVFKPPIKLVGRVVLPVTGGFDATESCGASTKLHLEGVLGQC